MASTAELEPARGITMGFESIPMCRLFLSRGYGLIPPCEVFLLIPSPGRRCAPRCKWRANQCRRVY